MHYVTRGLDQSRKGRVQLVLGFEHARGAWPLATEGLSGQEEDERRVNSTKTQFQKRVRL